MSEVEGEEGTKWVEFILECSRRGLTVEDAFEAIREYTDKNPAQGAFKF